MKICGLLDKMLHNKIFKLKIMKTNAIFYKQTPPKIYKKILECYQIIYSLLKSSIIDEINFKMENNWKTDPLQIKA
jgi:hypothetical protein